MKKIYFLASLAGILLLMSSCSTQGYVSSEPTYTESVRPQRPSSMHVWIDGDWVFNRQSRVYVHQNGYWQKPGRGRTYISGSWQSTPQGLRWQTGHWQR